MRLASSAVILTFLRKARRSFWDLINTIPIFRVYNVVKASGFVRQVGFEKTPKL